MDRTTLEGRINNNTWTIYPYDCRDALRKLEDNSIDCIFTSPPYFNLRAYGENGRDEGNQANYIIARSGKPLVNEIGFGQSEESYFNSLDEIFEQCFRVLKNNKCFFINIGNIRKDYGTIDLSHEIIKRAKKNGFAHRDTIIWIKYNPRRVPKESLPYYLDKGWEYLLMFSKGTAIINRDNSTPMSFNFKCNVCKTNNKIEKNSNPNYFHTNIGFIESMLNSKHQAKFPLSLPNFVFSLCTNEGDTILDPFAGVGTSLVAGLLKKLNVIGIEINMDYCNSANSEINALLKKV